MSELNDLTAEIRAFAVARDWEQFHTVRNLVLALSGEVGELASEIQWIGDAELDEALKDPVKRAAIETEIADVATYLLRLSDILSIDLSHVVRSKLQLNEVRYPVDKFKGNARKYNDLGEL